MSTKPTRIGILGGTFDPIHFGHLRIAEECMHAFDLTEVRFIPCNQPVHRDTPQTPAAQRLHMVHLATCDEPRFVVDPIECNRDSPSYMHTTLNQLKQTLPRETTLCLIVGSDAASQLHTWHRWRELLDLTHIIVASRTTGIPASTLAPELAQVLRERHADNPDALAQRPSGLIIPYPVTRLDISACAIRNAIRRQQSAHYLCPKNVLDYIEDQQLYRL